MKLIPLTKGKFAMVDDEDFEWLSVHSWCASGRYSITSLWINKQTKLISMHRMIMKDPVGLYVDHINGDGFNNQRINLRVCTNADNSRNQSIKQSNKSGFKGVTWDQSRSKWFVCIQVDYKTIGLGRYRSKLEAAAAYNAAALKYFGEFAKINDLSIYV